MSDPCTPADAARWLRENGPSVVWPTVTVERYAAYAAHVLGRVRGCGNCAGDGMLCPTYCRKPGTVLLTCHYCHKPEDEHPIPCPRCAGRDWTLTEAT